MVQWQGFDLVDSQLCTGGCSSQPACSSSRLHLNSPHDEGPSIIVSALGSGSGLWAAGISFFKRDPSCLAVSGEE